MKPQFSKPNPGRPAKRVTSQEEDFDRSAARAGLPPEFTPPSLRHCYASIVLAKGIPITEVSRCSGTRASRSPTRPYGLLALTSWDRARAVFDDTYRADQRPSTDSLTENPC
jgi:integrase